MADKTIVFGVNHKSLKKNDKIISAASCTTNCLAPIADVINKNFTILNGFMTTIHAFTSDQRILDNSHKDLRRSRSASQSIVPTSTGASKAIGEIIPSLRGRLEGVAMRVPTPNVSLVEFIFNVRKNITIKKLNNSLSSASKKKLKHIIITIFFILLRFYVFRSNQSAYVFYLNRAYKNHNKFSQTLLVQYKLKFWTQFFVQFFLKSWTRIFKQNNYI